MDPERVYVVEDCSAETLATLALALERSTTREQLVYREAELDDLWRVLDTALGEARRDSRARETVRRLERLLSLVREAHDLVGSDERPREAAARLRVALAEAAA